MLKPRNFTGIDLKVGGEGMKMDFTTRSSRRSLNKYTKKWAVGLRNSD